MSLSSTSVATLKGVPHLSPVKHFQSNDIIASIPPGGLLVVYVEESKVLTLGLLIRPEEGAGTLEK